MDQLTACQVLGVKGNSTREEIKEAYAALSKQFHPEEYPEEFQRIHEAYVTLTRRENRGSVQHAYREEENNRQEEQRQEYSFEDAMKKADMEAREQSHELVLEAAAELKVLVSPKYKNNLSSFKALFQDKKYETIIKNADFMERACGILEESELMKSICQYLIDFYHLRDCDPEKSGQAEQRLSHILNEKINRKKRVSPGVYVGVTAGISAGILAVRPDLGDQPAFMVIVFLLIVGMIAAWCFKKLRKKHSVLFSQAIIAILLVISQMIIFLFDLYGTLFGTVDDGNVAALLIMMAALGWLAVIIAIAVLKAIISPFKKK